MYSIGDQVVYGMHGVCTLCAIEKRVVDRKTVEYYALEPMLQPGTRYYVPTGNPAALAKLRPVLSRQAMEALLQSDSVRQDCWISDENRRKQWYRELINSGDRTALLSMVYCLHRHKREQAAQGRKFHLCDENFLRDAQRLLQSEISVVMEMTPEQAKEYLDQQLFVLE